MSLNVETPSITYHVTSAISPCTYTFPFTIYDADTDISAVAYDWTTDEVITLPAYTVTNNAPSAGGSIEFAEAIYVGSDIRLRIYRSIPLEQNTTYDDDEPLQPSTIEDALDIITAQIQDVASIVTDGVADIAAAISSVGLEDLLITATADEINTACDGSTAKNAHTHTGVGATTGEAIVTTWAELVTAIGTSTTITMTPGTFTMTASQVIPSTIELRPMKGAIITTTGWALTINGPLDAGIYQIFSGTGTVTFGNVANVYPEWFGAVGNGTTDDATAIRSAYDAAATCHATLVFQAKTYRFDSALNFDHAVNVRGTFQELSILLKHGNFTGITIGTADGILFTELQVLGDTANGGMGVQITNGNRIQMNRVWVLDHGSHGIELIMGSHGSYSQIFCHGNGGDGFRVYDTYSRTGTGDAVTANRFDGIDVNGNTGWGFNLAAGSWNIGKNIVSQSNGSGGVQLDYALSNHIEVYTESNSSYGISFTANSERNWVDLICADTLGYIDSGTNNWIGGCGLTFFGPQSLQRPKQGTNIAGRDFNLTAGSAGLGTTGRAGGTLSLYGGGADGTTGAAGGGNVLIHGGDPVNGGECGAILINTSATLGGDIMIGNSSVVGKIYSHLPLQLVGMTTTKRDTLTLGAGTIIYNSTVGKLQVRIGSAWETITSSA